MRFLYERCSRNMCVARANQPELIWIKPVCRFKLQPASISAAHKVALIDARLNSAANKILILFEPGPFIIRRQARMGFRCPLKLRHLNQRLIATAQRAPLGCQRIALISLCGKHLTV